MACSKQRGQGYFVTMFWRSTVMRESPNQNQLNHPSQSRRTLTIQWTNHEVNPCSWRKARENACERVTNGFGFTLIEWKKDGHYILSQSCSLVKRNQLIWRCFRENRFNSGTVILCMLSCLFVDSLNYLCIYLFVFLSRCFLCYCISSRWHSGVQAQQRCRKHAHPSCAWAGNER